MDEEQPGRRHLYIHLSAVRMAKGPQDMAATSLLLCVECSSRKLVCVLQKMARIRQGSQVIVDTILTNNLHMHLTYFLG